MLAVDAGAPSPAFTEAATSGKRTGNDRGLRSPPRSRAGSYIELGKINPADFDTDHLVKFSTGDLHFPSVNFQSEDALIWAASINVVTRVRGSGEKTTLAAQVMRKKVRPPNVGRTGA